MSITSFTEELASPFPAEVLFKANTSKRGECKPTMESAFALSHSSPFLKHQNTIPRFKRSVVNLGVFSSSSSSRSICSFSSLSHYGLWNPVPSLLRDGKRGTGEMFVKAASAAEEIEEEVEEEKSKLIQHFQLGVLISFWYLLTTLFNIYNKQILKDYPFPLTISALHFGIGTMIVLLMWTFKLHKMPKVNSSQLVAIVPLAVGHTLGNLFTNMSLGKVSVSFTHTIKAMEPFFSVVLSALFLGEMPRLWVVSSLVPVVGGVALASFTEASFDWIGFWSAMASNLTNQSRNVFSKKFMIKKEGEYLDNITLFSIITIMSFVLTTPIAVYMEGVKFTPMYLESAGLNVYDICVRSLMAGVFYHAYQQVAYVILERVSPVTHSVSNCVKRIVIIVASVLFFKTPVSPINSIGTGVAIAGVFLYSRLKQIKPKPKEE